MELPTPCHVLKREAVVDDNDPARVVLELTTRYLEDVVCAQVMTSNSFEIEFDVPEDAEIRATFNGDPVELDWEPGIP